jgi:hypothetical protein
MSDAPTSHSIAIADPREPTSEAVERVRNAVRDEYGSRLCYWPLGGGARCCTLEVAPECRCDAVARAAIEALREPTVAMTAAGIESDDKRTGGETCKHIWRVMIDAALADNPRTGGKVSRAES